MRLPLCLARGHRCAAALLSSRPSIFIFLATPGSPFGYSIKQARQTGKIGGSLLWPAAEQARFRNAWPGQALRHVHRRRCKRPGAGCIIWLQHLRGRLPCTTSSFAAAAIIDGTGKAGFSGDVAISDGRIAAVGGKQGPARREIDADGLLVTPGWVDVHTHYDGQAMWDPLLAPSCWHGVTTVMFGNCGVGFAPVKKEHRGALMDLMEGVEEIPNPVLAAGLNWEWESFPQYMDELDRRPRAIDIAAQIAHLPLRVYVMGDRAVRREAATSG